jgi:Icc-related predicted phosphoesterase
MRSSREKDRAPPPVDADVVVLAGDITDSPAETVEWSRRHFTQPVVIVAGNHELFGQSIDAAIREGRAASDDRVRFLENDAVVINGTRFIGSTLWTDFRLHGSDPEDVRKAMSDARGGMIDFQMISEDSTSDGSMPLRFTPASSARRHRESRDFISRTLAIPFDGPTVVVTHHAPHPKSVAPLWEGHPVTPCFVSDLSDVILDGQPEWWIHGHTHTSFDYGVGDTSVVCNPKMGNSWFHDAKTIHARKRPSLVTPLEHWVAGRIIWKAVKRDLGIVDEWAIRRELVGIRPWSVICEKLGVAVEAVAAVWKLTRPTPTIWPETIAPGFDARARRAVEILDGLDAEPVIDEIYEEDAEITAAAERLRNPRPK